MAQKTTLQEFESVFPKLQEALLEHAKSYKLPQEQLDWYKKVGAAQWTALAWVKKAAMANTTLDTESRSQHTWRKMQPRHVGAGLGVPPTGTAAY